MGRDVDILVVGAGIVGLVTAFELNRRGMRVVVADSSSPTRYPTAATGATYTGLDARHVSITETGPWNSHARAVLIEQPSCDGGWLAFPRNEATVEEEKWIAEFKGISSQPRLVANNAKHVYGLNQSGMNGWERLSAELPHLFLPTSETRTMPIVCPDADSLTEEHQYERQLDPNHVIEPTGQLPSELAALRMPSGGGVFGVRGWAYNAKSLCSSLTEHLQEQGVQFRFNQDIGSLSMVRTDRDWFRALKLSEFDAIVASTGVSSGQSIFDTVSGGRTMGVLGCWIAIPNPGIRTPFKIYGSEPTNFMNVTPHDDQLLVSGGYAFVGERDIHDARQLGQPTMDALVRETAKWFGMRESQVASCPQAMCIRPSLASGVPNIRSMNFHGTRLVVNGSHAAGGFTQAPHTASLVASAVEVNQAMQLNAPPTLA